mgnify:CR=1 FL=1
MCTNVVTMGQKVLTTMATSMGQIGYCVSRNHETHAKDTMSSTVS